MRIIAEFNMDRWKITLFQYGMKYTLQIEDGPVVQLYRFKEDEWSEDMLKWPGNGISPEKKKEIARIFAKMQEVKQILGKSRDDYPDDEFDEII